MQQSCLRAVVTPTDLKQFVDQFDPLYLDRLDPGESESLAFLVLAKEEYLISSGDAIVYRVLGNLNRGHQGISMEEVLQQIGMTRSKIPRQYSIDPSRTVTALPPR